MHGRFWNMPLTKPLLVTIKGSWPPSRPSPAFFIRLALPPLTPRVQVFPRDPRFFVYALNAFAGACTERDQKALMLNPALEVLVVGFEEHQGLEC